MRLIHSKSPPLTLEPTKLCSDPIYLLTQFFIPKDKTRQREVRYCLQKNCENPNIRKILLVNERKYSNQELGVKEPHTNKIQQIITGKRLLFRDIFDTIDQEKIQGYIVAVNSDIMLDSTIEKIHYTNISQTPSMVALLRYEYDDVYVPFETNCNQSRLFGPRGDSQDTWIIHSKQNIAETDRALFDFPFGKPGCDNKMAFLFHWLGYSVYNDPLAIRTYHYHRSKTREYGAKDVLPPVFEYLCPYGVQDAVYKNVPMLTGQYTHWNFEDNQKWAKILRVLLDANTPFVVPAVDTTSYGDKAFEACTYYFSRDPFDGTWNQYSSHETRIASLHRTKIRLWESLRILPVFIHHQPWTLALANLRVLIVSPNASVLANTNTNTTTTNKITKTFMRENTFEFVEWESRIDQKQALINAMKQCTEIKESYDIVLVDAQNYTNQMAYELFQMGKSALAMGMDVELLFGVYRKEHQGKMGDLWKYVMNSEWLKIS